MIKAQWKQLSEKTAGLAPREKAMVFGGILAAIVWLNGFYLIMPLQDQIVQANSQMANDVLQSDTVNKQIKLYQGVLGKDPNATVNQSLSKTEAEIHKIDQLLSQLTMNFISEHRMREVLNELLKNDQSIKVTEFTALAAKKLKIDGVPTNTGISIYQHGIRLTITGNYFDLQQYIQSVEQLPWQFNWQRFSYMVEQHPNAKLEIEMTTISTNEYFIAI